MRRGKERGGERGRGENREDERKNKPPATCARKRAWEQRGRRLSLREKGGEREEEKEEQMKEKRERAGGSPPHDARGLVPGARMHPLCICACPGGRRSPASTSLGLSAKHAAREQQQSNRESSNKAISPPGADSPGPCPAQMPAQRLYASPALPSLRQLHASPARKSKNSGGSGRTRQSTTARAPGSLPVSLSASRSKQVCSPKPRPAQPFC